MDGSNTSIWAIITAFQSLSSRKLEVETRAGHQLRCEHLNHWTKCHSLHFSNIGFCKIISNILWGIYHHQKDVWCMSRLWNDSLKLVYIFINSHILLWKTNQWLGNVEGSIRLIKLSHHIAAQSQHLIPSVQLSVSFDHYHLILLWSVALSPVSGNHYSTYYCNEFDLSRFYIYMRSYMEVTHSKTKNRPIRCCNSTTSVCISQHVRAGAVA